MKKANLSFNVRDQIFLNNKKVLEVNSGCLLNNKLHLLKKRSEAFSSPIYLTPITSAAFDGSGLNKFRIDEIGRWESL